MLVLDNNQFARSTMIEGAFAASPSKNSCMVRIHGQASRYRNDPYNYLVLPPIAAASAAASQQTFSQSWPLRRQLQSLPAAGRLAARVKAEVQRASTEFAEPAPVEAVTKELDQPLFALVHFKHDACMYQSNFPLSEGDLVVVEGDRGINMGEVTSVLTEKPNHPVPSRIVRLANEKDREQLRVAREREVGAQELSKHLVSQFRMDITIVDTEFQTDGNKLTVYFAAPRPVDFRRLQRALFRQYHCRIWLVNWNELPHQQTRV